MEVAITIAIPVEYVGGDAWHAGQGYVGNIRSAESYFWDKQTGLVGTGGYNVPKQGAQEASK